MVDRNALARLPDVASHDSARTLVPDTPSSGAEYQPVITLNGWSLPWRMKDGAKEFHLVAEPVLRELAPGMTARLWGYNGQSPGPTIEVVEGDRVRLFVTNRLSEPTSVHWHGQRLPNGMDGVGGLTQKHIPPGKTFRYEFTARRSGTFMYHPHVDEMVQMAMGMMGMWITHPRDAAFMRVDRDFCFLLSAYDIKPGSSTPNVMTMLEHNLWTFNSRVFPGIDPIVCGLDERVRIRVGNLTMTNHPIHLHGHEFEVVGTDGGWTPPGSRWPEVTTDVAVGQMRAVDFIATEPGDWAFHCHKSHHTMNAMGHEVANVIGVSQLEIADRIKKLVPEYMPMGEHGMAEMGEMEMPLPDNTLPMMTGSGPMGPIMMGGMFTIVKVREGLPRGQYSDPGWHKHTDGTVAEEWTGEVPAAPRAPAPSGEPTLGTAQRSKGGAHQH